MKRPNFLHGVLLAVLFGLASIGIYASLVLFLPVSGAVRILVTIVSGAYLAYLLSRSGRKTGSITLSLSWLVGSTLIHYFCADGLLFIAAQVGLLWLGRSIISYRRIIPVAIDLCLCAVALVATMVVVNHTHSLFLSVWTFFLIQSLYTAIPLNLARPSQASNQERVACRFNRARRNAESALHRIHESS